MGHRSMLADQQGQNYLHSEPCIVLGPNENFGQPNIRTMVSSSGNTTNLDVQYIGEHYDNAMIYGMAQYNGIQHHHNLDLGIASASNFYYSYMTPSSGSGALPVPRSHGASGQLPSASNYGVIGVSADELGRNIHFMDDGRGPFKRKYAEGIAGSLQQNNASSGSSSSVAPSNIRHPDGVAVMDAASFALPQYRGVATTPSLIEIGPQNSLRNRPGATGMDSLLVNDRNHLIQGNYMGQHFQPTGTLWLDQQLSSNSGDGGTSAWNQAPAMPYMHGSNVNGGSMEARSMGVQRYHETASNRSSPSFQHPPPINHRHHSHHHPSPPMQAVRSPNINFHPQLAAPSYRVSTNSSRSTPTPAQNSFEMGHRHPGPDEGIDSVARTGGNHAVSGLKFRILREFLQLGYSVLLSDIDIVYLQNPFHYLYRDSDVESMTDGHNNMTAYGYNDVFDEPAMGWARYAHTMRIWVYNSGFFYIRPTMPSIELLDRVANRLSQEPPSWDQAVFNEELFFPSYPGYDGLHAARRTMDFYLFMNSKVLFKTVRKDANLSKLKPVIIHVNYHPDKLPRMKAVVEFYVKGNKDALKPFPDGSS